MTKLGALAAVVDSDVTPGMHVHLTTHARSATRALQRVLRDREVGLTVSMCRVGGGHAADLVASGLVARVIAGSYGAVSDRYTGPLPQIAEAFASGRVEFEHWSFLSLTQRLIAAANHLPFVPTHSLAGSTMAADNAHSFVMISDPLNTEALVGLVAALRPDLAFVHAIAADEDGNAILAPPFEDGAWGAKASRLGAVVTTERIVSRSFIRDHSHSVQLPARYVRAVCETPFGAHPGAFGSRIVSGCNAYGEDVDFNEAYFEATRDREALAAWVDRWIYGCTHEQYLESLGVDRLDGLRAQYPVGPSTPMAPKAAPLLEPTDVEFMMTFALRTVIRLVGERGADVLLVGVGLSEVPGSAAWSLLAEEGIDLALVMGNGLYDYEPVAGRSEPDPATVTMATDSTEIYGVVLGGSRTPGIAILGAAQVDARGNVNSTVVDGQLLTGSGGSNDAASVCDTIVVVRHSPSRLVEQVEYVTCPGTNIRAVVTDKAIFSKDDATGRLTLTSYRPDASLLDVCESCGWEVGPTEGAVEAEWPTARELKTIRSLMPARYRR